MLFYLLFSNILIFFNFELQIFFNLYLVFWSRIVNTCEYTDGNNDIKMKSYGALCNLFKVCKLTKGRYTLVTISKKFSLVVKCVMLLFC